MSKSQSSLHMVIMPALSAAVDLIDKDGGEHTECELNGVVTEKKLELLLETAM